MLGKFWKTLDYFMAILLIFMIALVFTNVVLRYGFESGLRSAIELSRMFFVWVVMLGAVACLRKNEHLAVTEVTRTLIPKAVPTIQRLIWIVVIVCAVMLLMGSFKQTVANWNNISQITGLPKGLFYLPGVLSGGMMAMIGIARLLSKSPTESAE